MFVLANHPNLLFAFANIEANVQPAEPAPTTIKSKERGDLPFKEAEVYLRGREDGKDLDLKVETKKKTAATTGRTASE